MTREDIITASTMRLNGATFEEIGNHFGVSKQYIHQQLGSDGKHNINKHIPTSIYPGIANYFKSTRTNHTSMIEACPSFSHASILSAKLHGKRPLWLDEIREILAYTGLTFEEAFGGVDESEVAKK